VYPRYLRVANETTVSGIVTYISEAEVDDTDEIGVSGRCKFSSSLRRFRRRLWILRVPSGAMWAQKASRNEDLNIGWCKNGHHEMVEPLEMCRKM
jgi:hypothetical protein